VLLLATLGAPRRRMLDRRRSVAATPEPDPAPVATGRATVISVADPFPDSAAARRWLGAAGEEQLASDLAVLNRALHEFRLATADPYAHGCRRGQLLVARIGYGEGEQVAAGRWSEARELVHRPRRRRRAALLEPQARLAAALAGREPAPVCAELALRARLDVDHGRFRAAALQLQIALEAALAELPGDGELADRVAELRDQRASVDAAARAALAGELDGAERERLVETLARLEAALRALAFARA
jgi:hypothetical protein